MPGPLLHNNSELAVNSTQSKGPLTPTSTMILLRCSPKSCNRPSDCKRLPILEGEEPRESRADGGFNYSPIAEGSEDPVSDSSAGKLLARSKHRVTSAMEAPTSTVAPATPPAIAPTCDLSFPVTTLTSATGPNTIPGAREDAQLERLKPEVGEHSRGFPFKLRVQQRK